MVNIGDAIIFQSEWRNTDAHDGVCPFGIQDYCKSPNPYLARYGDDLWREKIEAS